MVTEQFEKLYLEMSEKMQSISSTLDTDPKNLSKHLNVVSDFLLQLDQLAKDFLNAHDEGFEIYFFKNIKPRFYSWRVYLIELFAILSNVPEDTDSTIKKYYLRELRFLQRYFEQNLFVYQYYLKGEDALDEDYFLRKNRTALHTFMDTIASDTNCTYQFSKFIAFERLRENILQRIRTLIFAQQKPAASLHGAGGRMLWTDDKVKLVELAYGIYFMKSINNGKADIADVVNWLEDTLHVDLGIVYRKFIDISRRKNKSYTVYLDGMRDSIYHHITDNNKYKPIDYLKGRKG